jgi:hypothetical protein
MPPGNPNFPWDFDFFKGVCVLTLFQRAIILAQRFSFKFERPFMKTIQMLAGCMVLAMAAMADVAHAETYTKPAAITVVAVQGEARYSTDGKDWHPLVIGKILRQGAVLETASGSSVDMILSGTPVALPESSSAPSSWNGLSSAPDPNVRGYAAYKPMAEQNVVRMQANTMLAVDQLTVVNTGADTVGNTEMDLRAGNIFVSVKKLSANSQYIIKLPNGVAGIRGATAAFGADDDVECFEGQITIVVMDKKTGKLEKKSIVGGFKYDPETGQIFDLSPSMRMALREFGISARTLFAQVVVIKDITYVYISPTAGRHPVVDNNVPPPTPPPGG